MHFVYCELKVIAIRMLSFYHVFLKLLASMILNINIYTCIYQFHSGTMFVSSFFLSRLSAWDGSRIIVKLSCHPSRVRGSLKMRLS